MKKDQKIHKQPLVEEPTIPYMKSFSSQEEAERYNMISNLQMSDMEKFQSFCRMMRIGKMLSTAKIVK